MNWKANLTDKAAIINKKLEYYLPGAEDYPPIIHEAMRYSLFAGGKRLRGALTMASAEACGQPQERVLPAACALEMIHAYSLIHDDLPAMDNDDFRRGKPTCHRIYGEAKAILAGDALLTLAFSVLCELLSEDFPPEIVIQVIKEVADAAGTKGLIGGQVLDLETEGCQVDREELEYIHLHKTAALFRVSVRAGALLSGACPEVLNAFTDYAVALGMAFQITDDILDLTGDENLLGKPLKSDLTNHKATYPSFCGLEGARQLAAFYVNKAINALTNLGEEAAFFKETASFLLQRQS